MADLPTNYLDDILSASMGGKRRFKITHLNGTSEEVTIEDISKYDQVGSTFGAGDINRTNQAVNEKFDSGDVVDPMLTTEPGFAADAYQTKLQFDEQNKKIESCNFDILLSHKGAGTCTISDITKYRYLLLGGAYGNPKEIINSVQIPTEMFKSGYRMVVASTTNQYYCGVEYISDTEVNVISSGMSVHFIGLY